MSAGSLAALSQRVRKSACVVSAIPLGVQLRRRGSVPTYLDVGGRGGPSARWRLMLQMKLVDCVLVEPDPVAAQALRVGFPSATVVPVALGDSEGSATLHLTREPGRSSLLKPLTVDAFSGPERAQYEVTGDESVSITRWDALHGDWPDPTFVKLDVQGYELHVLRGMERALAESIVGIQVEVSVLRCYERQPDVQEVWQWLDHHGFELRDLRPLGVHELGIFEFNAFFIRRNLEGRQKDLADFWCQLLGIPSHRHFIGRSD